MDKLELDKAVDNHQVKTEERVMRVDGHILTETKSTTFIEGFYSGRFGDSKTVVKYVRSIENNFGAKRSVKVTEHFINGHITGKRTSKTEGDLNTEEEMEQFEKDWDRFSNLSFLRTHPNLTHISQIERKYLN